MVNGIRCKQLRFTFSCQTKEIRRTSTTIHSTWRKKSYDRIPSLSSSRILLSSTHRRGSKLLHPSPRIGVKALDLALYNHTIAWPDA